MIRRFNEYRLEDSQTHLDWDFVISSLRSTYWAEGRPEQLIRTSFENSVVLSLYKEDRQVGFARIVSDYSCFAWLCDVYVDPEERGRGLGKFLMSCVKEHPSAQVRTFILGTKDAHGLYEQYGFARKEMMMLKREYSDFMA